MGWHAAGDSAVRESDFEFPEASHSREEQATAGPSALIAILPDLADSALLRAVGPGLFHRQPPYSTLPAHVFPLGIHRLQKSGKCSHF